MNSNFRQSAILAKTLMLAGVSAFLLSGCLVIGAAGAVAGAAVGVTGAVVGGAVNVVTGGSQADKDKRDAKKYREEHKNDQ